MNKTIDIDGASLFDALRNIDGAFKTISAEIGRIVSEIDKSVAKLREPAPEPPRRPVQQTLPIEEPPRHRARLGDAGFENEANPARRAVGQVGGLATAGIARAPSPDRRRPGTVMVKSMSVNEKRRYWRWTKDRAKARANGRVPPSWSQWTMC